MSRPDGCSSTRNDSRIQKVAATIDSCDGAKNVTTTHTHTHNFEGTQKNSSVLRLRRRRWRRRRRVSRFVDLCVERQSTTRCERRHANARLSNGRVTGRRRPQAGQPASKRTSEQASERVNDCAARLAGLSIADEYDSSGDKMHGRRCAAVCLLACLPACLSAISSADAQRRRHEKLRVAVK